MITIPLDTKNTVPLYEQIYLYIKSEIIHGRLNYQDKLPSTRNLSAHLQVSRNTIDLAYSQLVSEGYVDVFAKKGYFVAELSKYCQDFVPSANDHYSEQLHNETPQNDSVLYNFSPFAIDLNHFPFQTWKKLTKNCLSNHSELFLLGNNQGDYDFRKAIQNYLHQSRGVNCNVEQIIIGAGADYLLQLLAQIFPSSETIAMENPTYRQAFDIFSGFKFAITPIELDHNGMKIDFLERSHASIAYVTPSHQYPLGLVMPIKRRLELLEWANQKKERFIIEDDHDSEFRYKGKPIPALQGIDTHNKVIYLGTFSRAIAPAIRIGYMVLPPILLQEYQTKLSHYSSTVSRIDQTIMTHFITEGYFERHLNRMRKIYKTKHDLLLQALKPFAKHFKLCGEHAGLHVVIELFISLTEKETIDLALKNDIQLYGLSVHYITPYTNPYPHILLGYANLSESEIAAGVNCLFHLLSPYFTKN